MKQNWKSILSLLVLAIGLPFLVTAVQTSELFSPKASGATPVFVNIANTTDSSVTISWVTTPKKMVSQLEWGKTETLGTLEVDDQDIVEKESKERNIHSVTIKRLSPDKKYYFRITSGPVQYPEKGQAAYSFSTLSAPSNVASAPLSIYGEILNKEPSIILIYPIIDGSFANSLPIQTLSNSGNTWSVDISTARLKNGTFTEIAETTPLLLVAYSARNGITLSATAGESPLPLSLTSTLSESLFDRAIESTTPTVQATTATTPTPTTAVSDGSISLVAQEEAVEPTTTPISLAGSANLPKKDDVLESLVTPSVSNVTDDSFSISFLSYSKINDYLSFGTSTTSVTTTRLDDLDNSAASYRYLHHYTLSNLIPNSHYYFKSSSENVLRTFSLPVRISYPSGQTLLSGTLEHAYGECFIRTQIVRGSTASSLITTLPTGNSAWSVNIAPVRVSNLETFMIPIASDTVMNNAFCMTSAGELLYGSSTSTVQEAVTSGVSMTMQLLN